MNKPNPNVESEYRRDVLQFVSTLYGEGHAEAEQIATKQGWIDTNGDATQSGMDMMRALEDQRGTRSVFRPF
ncbi:MAG: hypothetical protein AAFZ74_13125 [Pseudomonadota bacterium]